MTVLTAEAVQTRCLPRGTRSGTGGWRRSVCVLIAASLAVFSVHSAQSKPHGSYLAKPHGSYRASGDRGKTSFVHRAVISRKAVFQAPLRRGSVRPVHRAGTISPEVVAALQAARQKIQADPFLLLAIAFKESSFDPRARNRHSSARGLLQFTTTTWLTVVRDFGPRYGLGHLSAAIKTKQSGEMSVASPRQRRAILALRDNPGLEIAMAAERLAQERRSLELSLGRPAVPADLYVLHLLGPAGAREFLAQLAHNPDRSSVDVVGSAANRNLGLFVRNGRTLSTAEAYAAISSTLTDQAAQHASLFDPQAL